VLPQVPIRQWVLSFPGPLRLVFATHPEVLSRVLAVVTRASSGAVIARAGCTRRAGAETAVVTVVQRFGSALNANVHLHMLVPDGAWTFAGGRARFHRAAPPSEAALERLLDTLIRRIARTLVRAGALVEDEGEPFLDIEPDGALAELAATAVRFALALGPQAGRRTMRLRIPSTSGERDEADIPVSRTPLTAARDGFSLNAAVACQARERRKLQRLCRYVSRGPIALERRTIPRRPRPEAY